MNAPDAKPTAPTSLRTDPTRVFSRPRAKENAVKKLCSHQRYNIQLYIQSGRCPKNKHFTAAKFSRVWARIFAPQNRLRPPAFISAENGQL
jgi:hypothetical protein